MPLVAAFTDDTSTLSEVRVSRMVRFHMERGARGFMVNSECGDTFQLTHSERKLLLEWVVRESHGLPVWVNITAMTTAGSVDLSQHASRHGAKGAVMCPPPVGRYYENEARAMMTGVHRHGNLQTFFCDPSQLWDGFESLIPKAVPVADSWTLLAGPAPDEMSIGQDVVTPYAMFGADKVQAMIANLPVFQPAMKSLIGHGGLNRAARAAIIELGCDVGYSRSPVFEMGSNGKKMLEGILHALGVQA